MDFLDSQVHQESLVLLESRDLQVHKDYWANQDHKVCQELDNLD